MIAKLTQSLQQNAKIERSGTIEVARTELSLRDRMKALQDSTKQWEQKEARPRVVRQTSVKAMAKELPLLAQNPVKRERSSIPVEMSISSGLNKFFNVPGTSTTTTTSSAAHCDIDLDAITSNAAPLKTPMRARAPNRKRAGGNATVVDERIKLETVKIDENQFVEEDEEPEKLETQAQAIAALQNAKQLLKSPPKKSTYPEVMLVQVRGFKHCDVRLIAPLLSSIHENACFIIVHKNHLIRYEGSNANVIERTKASQLCYEICNKSDLNCSAGKVDFIDYHQKSTLSKLLINSENIAETNNNDRMDCGVYSNEHFEIMAAKLNLVFRIAEDRTAQTCSRKEKLSVDMLQADETLIFDFGSEVYVWSGRNSSKVKSAYAAEYGKQLMSKNVKNGKLIIGDVESEDKRPEWTLFRKLHQGVRNTLFEAKFYDWEESKKVPVACVPKPVFKQKKPDVKSYDDVKVNEDEEVESLASRLLEERKEFVEPILILEDQEIDRKMRDFITEYMTFWYLSGEELKELEFTNEFDSSKCYVLKWTYRIQKTGVRRIKTGVEEERETGRSRVAYFYWLGEKTKSKQHGLCAYRIKDLDKENSPRIRIDEGNEPSLFLALFKGQFLVRCSPSTSFEKKTFVVCGANSEETSLREIENTQEMMRSHAAYIETNEKDEPKIVCGANCAPEQVKLVLKHAEKFQQAASCSNSAHVEVEGDVEARKFVNSTGRKHAMKVWRLFENEAEQVNHLSGHADCSFTFSQNILTDTILIDVGEAMWLWSEDVVTTFALKVADRYWNGRKGKAQVVCKGNEPNEFQALFLKWTNTEETEKSSQPRELKELLSERCRHFSVEELKNRENLPAGMDLRRLESYLSDENFQKTFKMSRAEFYEQKSWKQNEARKKVGLF